MNVPRVEKGDSIQNLPTDDKQRPLNQDEYNKLDLIFKKTPTPSPIYSYKTSIIRISVFIILFMSILKWATPKPELSLIATIVLYTILVQIGCI